MTTRMFLQQAPAIEAAAVMTRRFSGKFTEEAFLSARAGIRQGPTPAQIATGQAPPRRRTLPGGCRPSKSLPRDLRER